MNANAPCDQYPVSRYAAILGISPAAVRKLIGSAPKAGTAVVSGNAAALYDWRQIARLKARLEQKAAQIGDSVENLFRVSGPRNPGTVTSNDVGPVDQRTGKPFPLGDIHPEEITRADQLREVLLPVFDGERQGMLSQGSLHERAVADYETKFGKKCSPRYIRELLARTRRQAGALMQFDRLEVYLPEHPRLLNEPESPAPTVANHEFEGLQQAINSVGPDSDLEARTRIWRFAFSLYERLVDEVGFSCRAAGTEIRAFLWDRAPWLAESRDALLKCWLYNFQKWQAGKLGDARKIKTADTCAKLQGDLTRQIHDLGWFIDAAKFFYLATNRTRSTGSVPEAVLMTISLPHLPAGWPGGMRKKLLEKLNRETVPECPAELRATILQRQKNYQPLVPESVAKQIAVNPSVVQFYRSPRAWAMANLTAPGSQRRYFNRETNQREIMQPGDWFGGDDATPGIAVCVPSNEISKPSTQKFGVLIGRFQWLAFHDCRTDKIIGWNYVVRPRGSYRAEDIVSGMGTAVRANGVPRKGFQFEGGTFNSKLVKQAIELLGCQHWRTYSPHQKAIENVFNRVWTRLSVQFPHADMGRYRNENERNCKLYEACKRGEQDPRRYFPSLAMVLTVFEEITAQHNAKPIKSEQYGRWIPDEAFAQATGEKPLRQFDDSMAWIFSPFSVERKVRGMLVRCKVPIFEDFSVPFEFSADWLPLHSGREVRLHFNPRDPKCSAMVVLLEGHGQFKAGEILGQAQLIGETANHIRMIMAVAQDDQQTGFRARQTTAHFMHRESRGIGHGGQVVYKKSERRDGLGTVRTSEHEPATPPRPGVPATEQDAIQERLRQRLECEPVDRVAQLRAIEEIERQHQHLFM